MIPKAFAPFVLAILAAGSVHAKTPAESDSLEVAEEEASDAADGEASSASRGRTSTRASGKRSEPSKTTRAKMPRSKEPSRVSHARTGTPAEARAQDIDEDVRVETSESRSSRKRSEGREGHKASGDKTSQTARQRREYTRDDRGERAERGERTERGERAEVRRGSRRGTSARPVSLPRSRGPSVRGADRDEEETRTTAASRRNRERDVEKSPEHKGRGRDVMPKDDSDEDVRAEREEKAPSREARPVGKVEGTPPARRAPARRVEREDEHFDDHEDLHADAKQGKKSELSESASAMANAIADAMAAAIRDAQEASKKLPQAPMTIPKVGNLPQLPPTDELLKGPARGKPTRARPKSPCLHPPVELRRGQETSSLSLTRCDGNVNPQAVLEVSTLARPGGSPRPAAEAASGGLKDSAVPKLDARLLDRLQRMVDHFQRPGRKMIVELVSGSRPTAARSFHAVGRALDLRIEGVDNRALVRFCKTLPDTGCGYYPNSTFVHVDVREQGAGHVSWIDASGPGETPWYVPTWPIPAMIPTRFGAALVPEAAAARAELPVASAALREESGGSDEGAADDDGATSEN